MRNEIEKYKELGNIAQIGWWEANLTTGYYECSDFLCDLIGLEENLITFEDFGKLIREDYRNRVILEFKNSYAVNDTFYEQKFPLNTKYGEVWVHTRTLKRDENSYDSNTKVFGAMQCINKPNEKEDIEISQKLNDLLIRQNSISKSLLRFLNEDGLETHVDEILRDIMLLYKGSRVYIFQYDETRQFHSCTHEVVTDGVTSQIDRLQNMPTNESKWWTKQILSGKAIVLDLLNQLPKEANVEYEILSQQDIQSMMVTPLGAKENIWGYLGIDLVGVFRKWTNEDYQWLSSLANIISICLELRKAKDEVVEDQMYLNDLLKHLPMGYVRMKLIRNDDGEPINYKVIDTNDTFCSLFGVTREVFLGDTVLNLSGESKTNSDLSLFNEIISTKGYKELNKYYDAKRGFWTNWVIYSPQPDQFVALCTDTTNSVKINQALERSENLFKNVFENCPVGIEIYDKDGTLIDINNKDMEMYGVAKKEDAIGVNLFDNPNIPDDAKNQIKIEESYDFRITYIFDNVGDYFNTTQKNSLQVNGRTSKLFDKEGEFTGYLMISIDNTEKNDALARICDFENFFSLISEHAHVGYAKLNLLNKRGFAIKQWYKNLGEIPDIPISDVVGKYYNVHPNDRGQILEFYDQMLKGLETTFNKAVRVKRENTIDEWNWISMNIIVTNYAPQEDNIEIIGINYDITTLKETEAELITARDKAETMDRLKSAFLANMSHEIRTPLNAIVGFSELIADSSADEENLKYLNIIRENNELLLRLISDILDLAKIEAGTFDFNLGKVEVNSLCDDIVRSLRIKTKENVTLEFENAKEPLEIISDRSRLHQVISNFVNNASKFTSQGSIKVGYNVIGNDIEFYVSDTGIGLDKESMSHVFERFVKLNTFINGTGLGLSICQSIIEQMNGKIGVESKIGVGSRFWFTVPLIIATETTEIAQKVIY